MLKYSKVALASHVRLARFRWFRLLVYSSDLFSDFHNEDIEGVAYDFEPLNDEFKRTLSKLLGLFESVDRTYPREMVISPVNILYDDSDKYREFKAQFSKLKRLYETIAPDPVLFDYMTDYEWMIKIN